MIELFFFSRGRRSAFATQYSPLIGYLRSELETRLSYLEQELGAAREKVAAAEQQLRSRDQQLHFNSDSENEEFLNTIETQRLQLLALEDSLRQEKDNFAQLQRVLQVERGRGRREAELGGAQLDQALARERQKYSDLHAEYELLKRARYE